MTQLLVLNQSATGKIALDTFGNASYSDMSLINNAYYNLSLTSKYRLYLTALSNYSTYQSSFTISHTYPTSGLYNLTFTFASSNDIYQYVANITQCISIYFFTP